jgi:hypothetical protein
MATKIPKDFQPDDNSLALVAKHGAIAPFCADQLDHFKTYWLDTGKTKASWQATWQVWMRRAWQGKTGTDWEKSRHYRTQGQGSGNPFEAVLAKLQPGETPPLQHFPDLQGDRRPPKGLAADPLSFTDKLIASGESESMTAEAAFAELRKQGVLK